MAKDVRTSSRVLDGTAAHMLFEWDEEKSRQTFTRRQFDFAFAARVFADSHRLERIDRRRDYGEERWQTIGEIEGKNLSRCLHATWNCNSDYLGEKSSPQ
jgi:uncharacterized DUF497 family protein